MTAICTNAFFSDDRRRRMLYGGDLFVYGARSSVLELCEIARELSEQAFAPHHPTQAQHVLPVDRYVEILSELKPRFIHDPRCKTLIPAILEDVGCSLSDTYFDVPRLRTACAGDYLSSGLAYAFHPHRDTWYSAPFTQLNWWIPVYEVDPENTLAIHPGYWQRPVKNGSSSYNYQKWNRVGRQQAQQQIGNDTRVQPRPEEQLDLRHDVRFVSDAGGLLIFSAAHLHSTVPNTTNQTRFSIDFRTVHHRDTENRCGAPNIDTACTGTPLRDFLRGSDLSHLPESLIEAYGEGEGLADESCGVASGSVA